MAAGKATEQDWALRTAAYSFFVDNARAPAHAELADLLGIELDDAVLALRRFHDAHALFLDPQTAQIRMLNPFSAVPTHYQVEIGGRSYDANCAWDMLAIPGMLGKDAVMRGRLEVASQTIEIPVSGGSPRPDREYVVHYTVPFRDWYVDLIHT